VSAVQRENETQSPVALNPNFMAHDCKIVGAVRDKGFLIRRHQRRVLVQNVLPSFTLFFRASRDTCRVIALNLPASISYKFSSIWLLIIGSVSSGEIYLWPLIAAEHVVILRLAHWPKARITCKFFHFSIFPEFKHPIAFDICGKIFLRPIATWRSRIYSLNA